MKTLYEASRHARAFHPDHLLLKRGDVFEPERTNVLARWKSGRSPDEPLVISYYGESGARPVIKLKGYFFDHNGGKFNNIAFIGLDFYRSHSDPNSPDFDGSDGGTAMRIVGSGDWILIEDCRFRFCGLNIGGWEGTYSNLMIRRNIFTDIWTHNSTTSKNHTQAVYMTEVEGPYTFEENFFDHGGWNEDVEGAGANMFSHNLYIQYDNGPGGIIRGNIFARGASHGVQARSGGVLERNLFTRNAIAVAMGGVSAPTDQGVYDFDNRATENVILKGRLMDPDDTSWPRTGALWGISISYFHADFEDNIIANRLDTGSNPDHHHAFDVPSGEGGTYTSVDDIIYDWEPDKNMSDPDWPHPDDDLGDYYASIGGENDAIAYLEWLRERPLRTLPWEMTAYAGINYIREGFNKEPVEGYYVYEDLVAATAMSVSPETVIVEERASVRLSAEFEPANTTNTTVNWSSDTPEVATVSGSGMVTGVSVGTATITAESVAGGFTSSATVTVEPASDWAGYALDEGWAFAGERFLGWVYAETVPWLYSYGLNGWIYVGEEDDVTASGTWAFLLSLGDLGDDSFAPWVLSDSLDTWFYVPEYTSGFSEKWTYIWNSSTE